MNLVGRMAGYGHGSINSQPSNKAFMVKLIKDGWMGWIGGWIQIST